MKKIAKTFRLNYHKLWVRDNLFSLATGLGLFIVALTTQILANKYVNGLSGTPVDDVILKYLPTVNVGFLIVQGALILTAIGFLLFLCKPKYIFFGLKALAIFTFVRSFLITLTHLGPHPNQLVFNPDGFGFEIYAFIFNITNDFFFSGHTGIPILLALIFWPEKKWRIFFFSVSLVLGVSVLLAHVHYSIDVFAAPFITYSIFSITKFLFPKDYEISRKF